MSNKISTKVSIIIPVYNTEEYLPFCIDSVLKQTFKDFECILVDDCSPDNCPKICDEYEKRDNRIKVIHKKQNEGLPQARKTGFDFSKGAYILFVDSDDWIEPYTIERIYTKAATENLDIVVFNMYNNFNKIQKEDSSPELYDKITILKYIIMYWKYSPSVCDKMIRRDIYEKIIFPKFNYAEDKAITIQVFFYVKKIGYLNDHLYHYRQNQMSICRSKSHASKTIDEYNNFSLILNFLSNKNIIPHIEKELIARINTIKLSFLREKQLRDKLNHVLIHFYPKSTNNIFKTDVYSKFHNKVFLNLATKHIFFTFFIIDIYILIENTLKRLYKLIVPTKIRMFLWSKRQR